MWSVHPDAFQNALAPIPRDGVVGAGVVPIDGRCAAIESSQECEPDGKEQGFGVHSCRLVDRGANLKLSSVPTITG
jgi:hypothetical protein